MNASETARELVALSLADDDGLDDAIESAAAEDAAGVIEILVHALASTWDSLDDFSDHIIKTLAESGDDEETS